MGNYVRAWITAWVHYWRKPWYDKILKGYDNTTDKAKGAGGGVRHRP
jgi:hypothetical protein